MCFTRGRLRVRFFGLGAHLANQTRKSDVFFLIDVSAKIKPLDQKFSLEFVESGERHVQHLGVGVVAEKQVRGGLDGKQEADSKQSDIRGKIYL